MFPGPGANIIRNEAGEPLGWDYPSEDEPPDDWEDQERRYHAMKCEGCDQHPDDCECECWFCPDPLEGEGVEHTVEKMHCTFKVKVHRECIPKMSDGSSQDD